MHMWNWFTGVRAGAHFSISSSTELKIYHLFVFKAKKHTTYFTSQRKKSWQSIFSTGRVGLQPPHSHPHSWTQRLVSPRLGRKWNAHVSLPPLPLQFFSKTALLLQPRTIPGPEGVPRRGILAVSFLKLYSKVMFPKPEESFGKAML